MKEKYTRLTPDYYTRLTPVYHLLSIACLDVRRVLNQLTFRGHFQFRFFYDSTIGLKIMKRQGFFWYEIPRRTKNIVLISRGEIYLIQLNMLKRSFLAQTGVL